MDPACAQALNLKGVLLCAHGKHGAAAEHFQRAAALRPDYADALCNLGAVRLRANDPDRAQAAFRQALEADATCFAAHLALGEIAQAQGDDHVAIASYEAAIRADAEEPAAWLGLARSYMRSQAYEPAARAAARRPCSRCILRLPSNTSERGTKAPMVTLDDFRGRRRKQGRCGRS